MEQDDTGICCKEIRLFPVNLKWKLSYMKIGR